jgi:hypothetical protein
MPMFLRLDFTKDELLRLNKVRIYQQVFFYSDVMDARGTALDRRYLSSRLRGDTWSTHKFPLQQPPRKDLKFWAKALLQLRYVRQGMTLGRYTASGHKAWEWRYVEDEHSLLHFHDNIMDTYSPSDAPRYAHRPNFWSITQADQPWRLRGEICTVQPIELGVWKIISQTPPAQLHPPPTTLNEVFHKWGCMWLWRDLQWQGDTDWIRAAIANNTCIVIADGSYMPSIQTNLCSTAFFFDCSAGSGKLRGSFIDFSASANAYRGELL